MFALPMMFAGSTSSPIPPSPIPPYSTEYTGIKDFTVDDRTLQDWTIYLPDAQSISGGAMVVSYSPISGVLIPSGIRSPKFLSLNGSSSISASFEGLTGTYASGGCNKVGFYSGSGSDYFEIRTYATAATMTIIVNSNGFDSILYDGSGAETPWTTLGIIASYNPVSGTVNIDISSDSGASHSFPGVSVPTMPSFHIDVGMKGNTGTFYPKLCYQVYWSVFH